MLLGFKTTTNKLAINNKTEHSTAPCLILLMPNTRPSIDKYKFLRHFLDSIMILTYDLAHEKTASNLKDSVIPSSSLATTVLATHSGDPPPEFIGCQSPLTLKRILLNCVDFLVLRQQFYSAGNMHDLFFFF